MASLNQIIQNLKAIPYNPGIISNDPQLAYLLSFSDYPITNDSVQFHPRDSYQSPLSQYQYADFDDLTYESLLQQTIKNYRSKNISVVKGIKSSFKQFYGRVSALTYQSTLKYNIINKGKTNRVMNPSSVEYDYRVQTMKGNIPAKWPEGLNQFQKELQALPWNAFSTQSELLLEDFIAQIKNSIIAQSKKLKNITQAQRQNSFSRLIQTFLILISLSLRTLSQPFILSQILFITNLFPSTTLQLSASQQLTVCQSLGNYLKSYISKIPSQNPQLKQYHSLNRIWDINGFLIMKKIHFQKVSGISTYTITTDGNYLYIYVSAINGGMWKVGTGFNGTVAGKVYYEKLINLPIGSKIEQVNWVYLKGKLYLKTFTRDPSHLEVIDTETFKKLGYVQLVCQSLFGHHILNTINKNSIILTDGIHLYFLGKRIKIIQNNQVPVPKVEQKKQQQPTDQKNKKKIKNKKKNQNVPPQSNNQPQAQDQTSKIIQFVLAQFDIEGKIIYEDDQSINQQAINELFDSFSGYFTRQQCKKAYRLNHYDIMQACQWLFDQGSKQKQKNIKLISAQNVTIICESQINSNFNQKTFKNPTQIVTKQGSVLHINNIHQSIWTMDQDQITCYSQNGIKIFDKKGIDKEEKDKPIPITNRNSLLLTKDKKFQRNPEFNFVHDPYNGCFYVLWWHKEGRFFPCPLLISKDNKFEQNLLIQKRSSIKNSLPQNIKDLGRFFTTELCLLNKISKLNYRFSDPLYIYGRKISLLNAQPANASYEEKKKLSNKKSKLMTKINKINQITKRYQSDLLEFNKNRKITRQIIKIYPFCSDGSLNHLRSILKFFEGIQNYSNNSHISSFLLAIDLWFKNIPFKISQQIRRQLDGLLQIVKKIRQGPSTSETNKLQINKLIIKNFNIFYSNPQQAIQFLSQLPYKQIDLFIHTFEQISLKNKKEFIIYQIATKQQIVNKYDSKYDFAALFKQKSNVFIHQNSIITSLLLREDKTSSSSFLNFQNFIQNCISSLQTNLAIRFFIVMFSETFKYLMSDKKFEQKRVILLENLFEDSFKILQKALLISSLSKIIELIECISFIVQVYYSSVIRILGNENILKSILKILEIYQKNELSQFFSYVKNHQFEGIQAIQQKIYQTCHPLQRGKSQSFPQATYPQASLLYLQFDKRCQSDQNHDIMSIQLLHEDSPVGTNIQINDGVFNTSLRLSGKVQMKRPTLMFGNSVSIDFNSSGHAKDAQSFGRFGFKFGLRPVIAGKVIYEKNANISKIQKVFKNKSNFKSYINTLKFLVVAASASIQSLYNIEDDIAQSSIKQLLKGKIIRQGLQENKKNQLTLSSQEKINNFLSKQQQGTDKQILRLMNLHLLKKQPKVEQNSIQKKGDIWVFDGIPQYIKSYLQQIKVFNGDFIQVFKQARVHAPPQGSYSQQLKRPSFTPELKQLWLKGEALLFLTVLKHSGLLHLNLKFSIQYIKQNLKAFQQARNGIFYSFITRMQNVREWRDLIQTYHGKIQEEKPKEKVLEIEDKKTPQIEKKQLLIRKNNRVIRTVQFNNNKLTVAKKSTTTSMTKVQQKTAKQAQQKQRLKQIQKQIRERLNNEFLIQQLCALKKIKFIPNNVYENVTKIIEQLKKESPTSQKNQQSVYIEPIQHLIEGCIFLLTCKSPSTKQNLEQDQEIVPMALGRSLSSDHKNANINKVQLFRQWLQNWKKWKGFKKQNKIQLKFPVLEIVQFINSWTNIAQFKSAINQRGKICEYRITFYKYMNQLLKITNQNVIFNKYIFGSQIILNSQDNYKNNLESASVTRLQVLKTVYNQFTDNLKEIQNKFISKQIPLTYNKFTAQLKKQTSNNSVSYKSFLQRLKINAEILYLLQSQNPKMSLDIALFFINFKYISNQNEELLFLANLLAQRALLINYQLDDILYYIRKQVGDNGLLAKRWKDLIFIERLSFLLRKLQMIVRKKSLEIDQKEKVASTLFYILNLTDVPFITRISLKIIKKLKDLNLNNVPTPFNQRFKSLKIGQNLKIEMKQYFSIDNPKNYTNIQLMAIKANQLFDQQQNNKNYIKNKLVNTLQEQKLVSNDKISQIQQSSLEKNNYNIILNLHHQQDLIWFLRVLYYIQQLQRQSGKGFINDIKDWNEYLQMKNIKQNKKQQQQNQQQQNIQNVNVQQIKNNKLLTKEQLIKQRIFANIPHKIKQIDQKIQSELPVGWFMNYCNVFKEYSNYKLYSKNPKPSNNGKQNKQNNPGHKVQNINPPVNNKKAWQSTIFIKVSKKFQEFNSKHLQQPKQTDSQMIKAQFIKAKNFINRIRKHLYEISTLISQFTNQGYVVFRQDISKAKAQQICQIISLGSENRLKSIPLQFQKDQYKTRIIIEDNVTTISKMKVTLIDNENYQIFDQLISLESVIPILNDHQLLSFTLLNKRQHVLTDSSYLPFEDFFKITQLDGDKQQIQFSKEFIDSRIFKMKKKQEQVYLPDYKNLKYCITQGGIQTGLKNVTLIPTTQHTLTQQSVPLQNILTQSTQSVKKSQDEQETDFPEEIIQKLVNLIRAKISIQKNITTKQHLKNYLLASFYLKKLSRMSLQFIEKDKLKDLASALLQINNQGFKSFQPIEHYENEMQTLLIKFIDNTNQNLNIFEIFNPKDYDISLNISAYQFKKQENKGLKDIKQQQDQQSFALNHFPKSSYLLKSHPPQMQQNKLLKYWQKNILPKIYEFVKTTLRPIQIQDFFQQMRIPLRKNDQMQAKKIAYVICDNKLPQGAVLPDSNHNWNSFTLQDITVGQYALVKLPKSFIQSISPLLITGNQQYRLVKIVFIDLKNSSVLVRYRIDQYSIMSYVWVPINSLVRVEKQIMHLPPKDLFAEIQKNLKGIIYGYSKKCLTQLTSVSNLDQSKLIKQTISDMFVHDPISGWQKKIKQQWPMRNILKKIMNNNQLSIIQYLQKQFCPILSYETDLFKDQIIKLNRFQNVTSLIVSFKKTSAISLTSGIKFYKDPYLFNQIIHVYTIKSQKTQFQPLIFNDPNVYSKYYTNKECLKIADQNKYVPKPINVTVFGINQIWTIGCYLGEVISEIAESQKDKDLSVKHLEMLRRLNKLYLNWIKKKKVAVLCGQLAKLISTITKRIIMIQERLNIKTTNQSLGVDQQTLKQLINWIKALLQQQQSQPLALYSQILQNLSEMVSSLLMKTYVQGKGQQLPTHIEAIINLQTILRRINDHLKGEKICMKFQPTGQWERFLEISQIPNFVDRAQLIKKMKQIIKQNKGKILCPKYDFFLKDDKLIICVQGWNITELVEEEIVQKIQKQDQQEQKQQQDQGMMMQWSCQICTFVNPMGNSHCEMCGTQMPPPPVAKQIYQQVQATDVSKAENKLKQLEAKRFETIREQIKQFFFNYWTNYCKNTEKQNKIIEQKLKSKDNLINNKNKKVAIKQQDAPKEQDKVKQIPVKPQIILKTGSEILNNSIIQDFLQFRWSGFKQNIKKLVESQTTYLAKFKRLETLGYDLWCDQIFHQNPSLIPFNRLYQLMNYIQGQICKGSSSVLSYSQNSIRLMSTIPILQNLSQQEEPINYQVQNDIGVKAKYKNLAELKSYNVRYSWKLVKQLNVAASKCLQFINMNLKNYEDSEKEQPQQSSCLGFKIKYFRNLIMGAIKLELNQKIIQKTSVLRQPQQIPKIYLERLRIKDEKIKLNKPVSIKQKEDFLFTKSHQQFFKISSAMLRPFKPKGTDPYLSFSITFRGQNAMGEAGPYRQFFTDISNQLDPKNYLGLFIPTPNNKHNSGQSKSKWLINPKANSSYQLSLYEYIGTLMGCCIRTGTHLALDLPKIFWKLIVGEKVNDSDLQQTDHQFVQNLKMIKDIPNQEMFLELGEYTEPLTWTYTTSDGDEHQILFNGKTINVTYEERFKYIEEVKSKRINESNLQINKIKKGLQQMMPQAYFNCITGDQIKLMVCGRPKVDVDLLKKHTKYAGGLTEEDNRIKYFWEVMKDLQQSQKLKVIKFCWGQQRLPINSEQFQRNNIRFMIKPMLNQKNNDQALPKADTCFFNIELPNYSTKQILRQRLLLAVNLDCVSINADQNFNPDDNPLMGEVDDDYQDENQEYIYE